MHGRLKVRSPEEQQELVRKEKEKKLHSFQKAWGHLVDQRAKGNLSSELLVPTESLLTNVSDLYSLWNYRREILLNDLASCDEDGKKDAICHYELCFTESCLLRDPKSYSTWHHRRWTLLQMVHPDWQKELGLCDQALRMDERNFHCWGYRRFVVEKGSVPLDSELAFSTKLIKENFSNYSSWHYRTTLLPLLFPQAIPEAQIQEELKLVLNAVFTDPNDQSAWFYSQFLVDQIRKADYTEVMRKLVENVKELWEEEPENAWVLHAYVKLLLTNRDLLDTVGKEFIMDGIKMDGIKMDGKEFVSIAVGKLSAQDPLRSGYYHSLKSQI
ncbi:Geranylgeranyl transferase type-2 subunit alpha [Hypsibius exemplaris]|uniref:Geranylgeranyl transferase type-2 subunit alpha n=1 Tax=Hypsibius exemplaris TaxID=2072580 RepID=A0A1W0XE06_HYPEX|nr:Geranylgeranyl transferase type-2 subunit alpha [Hypsibius exemplaris]